MSEQNLLGFKPPPDFPIESYHAIRQCLNKYANTHKDQVSLFRLGWNGLGYRYRAMVDYEKEFVDSIYRSKKSPSHEELYKQDKALFGFFNNAISIIECFFFSTYCIASIIKLTEFPLTHSNELKIFPDDVKSKFKRYFKGNNLTIEMEECLSSNTYKQMCRMRIVRFHRGTPPRSIYVGGDKDGEIMMPSNPRDPRQQWQFDLPVDEKITVQFQVWLNDTLKELVESNVDFCTQRLP